MLQQEVNIFHLFHAVVGHHDGYVHKVL
jgi:hypothetical protein